MGLLFITIAIIPLRYYSADKIFWYHLTLPFKKLTAGLFMKISTTINKNFLTTKLVTTMAVSALALTACSTQPAAISRERLVMVNGVPSYYIVQTGDTLSRITSRYGLDYRRVAALNGLDSDYKIYVGQKLRLVNGTVGAARPVAQPSTYNRPIYNQSGYNQPNYNRPAYQPAAVVPTTNLTQKNWLSPVTGTVTRTFDGTAGIKGQWYSAAVGSPVIASQAGTVLYAGNQLAEYGNLIMIRHNNDFVSAYAHLGQFNVKEGQNVTAGQQIGTVGTVNGQPALEFQIRYRGTPVNPVAYVR